MDDFEREMKTGFLDEAAQMLTDVEQSFLVLETDPSNAATIEKIFRLAHNLKGSGRAVGFEELAEFTHKFESLLLKLKTKEIAVEPAVVGLLLRCKDHISVMVEGLRQDLGARFDSRALMGELDDQIQGRVAAAPAAAGQSPAAEPAVSGATVSMSLAPTETTTAQKSPTADESIRVSLQRVEKLINFVGELVIMESVLKQQTGAADVPHTLRKSVHQLGKVAKEIQDISMSLRMIPLRQTFQKMQRIVRDTSQTLNKKIQLTITGDDTEIDKTVLEHIGDPLVHLIRNSVDHGIEAESKRVEAGKPAAGQIALRAYHKSDSLIIEVEDDGNGLNAEILRKKAIEKGVIKADAHLTEEECHRLIFAPGFSTKSEVSEVSGRGVGLDVVKTNIERLQGSVQIETKTGRGTMFRIRLPLTLSIIDGMIVQSATERFVIPLAQVHESVRPNLGDIHPVAGAGEVFSLRGEVLPFYCLSRLLGRTPSKRAVENSIFVVVRPNTQAFAVRVDDIVGQSQVVLKRLGQEHRNLKGFSGSAILGDGKPSLILELPELVRQFQPTRSAI